MPETIIDNIKLTYPDCLPEAEAIEMYQDALPEFRERKPQAELIAVEILLDGEGEVVINFRERSPVKRIRRITGYLAPIDAFNDAKRAELDDREPHWLNSI